MKKFYAVIAILGMAASLCACHTSTTYSSTTTTTTTTTDADGKVTTTTTVTTDNNYPEGSCVALAQDGQEHTVSISIENETGEDMNGLYVCNTGETEWGNLFGEDEYLGDGSIAADYLQITYTTDSLVYDMGIKDENGDMHEFDEVDISDFDADGFTITFSKGDDGFYWTVDESYVKR